MEVGALQNMRWKSIQEFCHKLFLIVLGVAALFLGCWWNNWFNSARVFTVIAAVVCVFLCFAGVSLPREKWKFTAWSVVIVLFLFVAGRMCFVGEDKLGNYQAFAVGDDQRAWLARKWQLYPIGQRFILIPNRLGQYEAECYNNEHVKVCKLCIKLDLAPIEGFSAKEITNFFGTSTTDILTDEKGKRANTHISRIMQESFKALEHRMGFRYVRRSADIDYPMNSTYTIDVNDPHFNEAVDEFQFHFTEEFKRRLPRVCRLNGPIQFVKM
jgi:hypothetical protein